MAQLQRLMISATQLSGQQVLLTDPQQHYLSRVLRLRGGDRFIAMDGQGQGWLAVLQADGSTAEVVEAVIAQTELSISVTLLLALPKTGMDDVVRQATEIGVQRIVPILSQRTVLNPSAQKLDRWQRIIQEAAEQSERQLVPELLPPQAWEAALQTWNRTTGLCYLCEARGEHPHLLKCLLEPQCLLDPNQTWENLQPISLQSVVSACMIAIGPEGGWTDQEIDQAVTAGYQPVSLGARILRSITAPLVALSLVAGVMEIQRDTVS